MNPSTDTQALFAHAMSSFLSEEYEKSIETLTEVIDLEPHHRLALSARGSAHMKLNDLSAAVADFDRLVTAAPTYAKGYHLRGLAREKQGDDSGALADFDTAVSLDPDYGAAYYSRATLLTKLGDADKASEDIEMVTHLTNRNIETFANESNVWRSQHMKLETTVMESDLER